MTGGEVDTLPTEGRVLTRLVDMDPATRRSVVASLSDEDALSLEWDWEQWARPEQLPPSGDWQTWLVLAGRGFGKTRCGAEWARAQISSGKCRRLALVGPTAADVRDVLVEGESGLMAVSPPWDKPVYEPTKRRVTWRNGAIATLYSADEPERLRGPQHDGAVCDELASWRYIDDAWNMLMFGLRLGMDPRVVVTTTPKPIRLVRELMTAPTTAVTRGSTYDNAANLAPAFLQKILTSYEGTRLGRQEIHAEILEDVPGALWKRADIDALRVRQVPDLTRIVVAVDPAVTSRDGSDETGIIVAGRSPDGHGYVLEDLSGRWSPDEWARRAVDAFKRHSADRIVAEVNQGGDLVEKTIRTVDETVPFKAVRATRGKVTRAEPVAALYEQGRIHHLGTFGALEDQQATYTPEGYDGSPDRVDALVWAFSELMLEGASVWAEWVMAQPDATSDAAQPREFR